MTFTRTGPNSAVCEGEFQVKIAKRHELHYVTPEGVTIIPIEIMTDRVIVVSVSNLPANEKRLIRLRIAAALDYLNIPHRFD
jgi:hypothetical protein